MSSTGPKIVLRKLTEAEQAFRLAHKVLDRASGDPDDDLAMLSRQLLRAQERYRPRDMLDAPRDGTHILAYLYHRPADGTDVDPDTPYPGFGEWREIFFKTGGPMGTCWHSGDPYDSHSGNEPPEHYGEALPIAWMPLPDKPLRPIE